MVPTIAALTGADEFFNHQIVNTFAAVATPERAWTEKAWFTLMRKDGSLQAGFGLGKYANRNIVDGFAGVQIGTRQFTVRASRLLDSAPEAMGVGPLGYDVVEPLKAIRLTLAENAAQPLRFELTFHATMPGFFENRDVVIQAGRAASDVIRYHQAGTVSGWIEIEGQRHEVNPDEWFGFRDRSWGVREHVGLDPADLAPTGGHGTTGGNKAGSAFHFNWLVSKIDRADGTSYDLAYYFRDFGGEGPPAFFSGYINESDGRQIPILHLYPEIDYRASDRGAMRGTVTAIIAGKGKSVEERMFEIEVINPEMGFRLLPGMYGEWKGQIHGSYKGEAFLDGETIEDVNNPAKLAETYRWQIRDRPVRIREGANGGYGDMESIILGDYPGVRIV
ncbi:hypothetical protein [Novosphingobium sp. MMS21-SN21R]|uniref:hypothetical protein n=1 Tax=Novosphingobium sp. MMS21-SN21R TaxID=2969298 RepID=UPI0028885E38|nr:hypothetical protein [Novosphingobium sp. MMS21-SN21R]MDT0509928.1 hypothetical protein [Novosphingobium sp. MMS21-SN21R]